VDRFSYRPAPLQGPAAYTLDGNRLTLRDGRQLDLARVEAAVFVEHAIGDTVMRRLDLRSGTETVSLAITAAAGRRRQ
jgi:hypothetical protein